MSDALANIKSIKDIAKLEDPPTGFLVEGIILLIEKTIGDPIGEIKGDAEKHLFDAWDGYNDALRVLTHNQNDITRYEVAHEFLGHYLLAEAHSQVALSLIDKIFENYSTIKESLWRAAGWRTWGLSDFVRLAWEAKQVIDWTWDATDQWLTARSNAQFQLWPHRLHEAASYTLALAQSPRLAIEVHSPVELRVYDSEQRVTGLVNGEERNEIPYSVYHDNSVTIFSPTDLYDYEVVGTGEGSYDLSVTTIAEEVNTFIREEEPTSAKAVHQYSIDWEALSKGKKGVTMKIDSDGDGTFEETRKLGSEGAGFSWVWIVVAGVSGLVGVLVGAFIVRRRASKERGA